MVGGKFCVMHFFTTIKKEKEDKVILESHLTQKLFSKINFWYDIIISLVIKHFFLQGRIRNIYRTLKKIKYMP